jgi:hypothetical protein
MGLFNYLLYKMITTVQCDFCKKDIQVSIMKITALIRINKIIVPCYRECLEKPKKMLRQQKLLLEMLQPVEYIK